MSKFSEQVHVTISSFEKNVIYYDLKLTQKMADHHYFSFSWQYTGKAVIDPEDQEKAISKHNGSEVIFTFKVNGIRVMSKGIIKGLTSVDLNGSPAGLHVQGISHSVLLDDLIKSRIFLSKNLQQIALELFAEASSGEFYHREAIVPTNTSVFKSRMQYNETSFNFLKRLSSRYGQWFYFDGMRMQFGQTKTSNVKLISGSSLHQFTIQTNLVSHKASFGGYDYTNASNIRNAAEKTSTGSRDRFAISNAYNQIGITRNDLAVGAYTNNAQNKEEIDAMIKLETAAKDANGVFYSGISYFPIGVGQVFTIQNKTVEHELLAIEVIHHSQVNGNYSCEFTAIPADVAVPHYTDPKLFTIADSQPAKVSDNNDPEKMGRVKVQYYWNGWGNESDWMRVLQNYSGQGGRGIYWRPEIGDEVIVAFEGGNADCPYVSGSHFNGLAMPEFFEPNNMIKAIKMRFGQLLKFIEKVGIWLSDPSGNTIHLDEENKNINITSPETITIKAKNIVLEATESITATAGVNITESAGKNHISIAGANMVQNAIGNYNLQAANIYEDAIGERKSKAKDIHELGRSKTSTTEKETKFNAQSDIKTNSGEKTNFH
ncbi:type VI secretion system Vgr family protein [Flavobacterium sp. 3-218]